MRATGRESAIRQSLAETVAWCREKPLTAEPYESKDVRRRRGLMDEAHRLNIESFRRYGHSDERAFSLIKEANYPTLILLRDQLRSKELIPSVDIGGYASEDIWMTAVEELIQKRSSLLKLEEPPTLPLSDLEGLDRLLVYWPSENLADGAAEYSSNGFFDCDNTPPWDTWFHFSNGRLFAWVPGVLIPLAQNGIDVNPENCIQWADWSTLGSLES
jgi:hypothetical protein